MTPTTEGDAVSDAKTEAPKKAARTTNPELQLMAQIDRKLAALDDAARARVVAWLVGFHGPKAG